MGSPPDASSGIIESIAAEAELVPTEFMAGTKKGVWDALCFKYGGEGVRRIRA